MPLMELISLPPSLCLLSMRSFAFGMGGLEKTAYDSKEKIFYGVSEQGIVSSEN